MISHSKRYASVVLALIVAWTHPASADRFAWSAPTGCPDDAAVRERIVRRLGGSEGTDDIAVTVTRSVGRFEARIAAVASQTRTLTSARCDELADAVAVIVARLATEARAHRIAVVEASAMIDLHTVRPPPVAPVHAVRAPAERAAKWGGGGRLLALSGIGVVPHVGVGVDVAGFVRRRDAFAEIGYARWATRPTYLVAGAAGRVDVGVQMTTLRGGWAPDHMPLRAWLGVELGAMSGTGVGLQDSRTGSSRWTAIAAGFGVAWPISERSRLVGTFEVAAAVERARFTLMDGSEAYQASPASARCALGIEVGWR